MSCSISTSNMQPSSSLHDIHIHENTMEQCNSESNMQPSSSLHDIQIHENTMEQWNSDKLYGLDKMIKYLESCLNQSVIATVKLDGPQAFCQAPKNKQKKFFTVFSSLFNPIDFYCNNVTNEYLKKIIIKIIKKSQSSFLIIKLKNHCITNQGIKVLLKAVDSFNGSYLMLHLDNDFKISNTSLIKISRKIDTNLKVGVLVHINRKDPCHIVEKLCKQTERNMIYAWLLRKATQSEAKKGDSSLIYEGSCEDQIGEWKKDLNDFICIENYFKIEGEHVPWGYDAASKGYCSINKYVHRIKPLVDSQETPINTDRIVNPETQQQASIRKVAQKLIVSSQSMAAPGSLAPGLLAPGSLAPRSSDPVAQEPSPHGSIAGTEVMCLSQDVTQKQSRVSSFLLKSFCNLFD